MYIFVFFSFPLSSHLYLSLSLFSCQSLSLSLFHVCLSLSSCLSLSLFTCLSLSLSLFTCLSLSFFIFVSFLTCLSLFISISTSSHFCLFLCSSLFLLSSLSQLFFSSPALVQSALSLYARVKLALKAKVHGPWPIRWKANYSHHAQRIWKGCSVVCVLFLHSILIREGLRAIHCWTWAVVCDHEFHSQNALLLWS